MLATLHVYVSPAPFALEKSFSTSPDGGFAAAASRLVFFALPNSFKPSFARNSTESLAEDLPLIDEYRALPSFYYFTAGPRAGERAKMFGDQIADLVEKHGGGNRRPLVNTFSNRVRCREKHGFLSKKPLVLNGG